MKTVTLREVPNAERFVFAGVEFVKLEEMRKDKTPMFYKYICSAPVCPALDSDKSPRCKCRDPKTFGRCPLGKAEMIWKPIKEVSK